MSLHLLAFPSRRGMPNKGGGLVLALGFGSAGLASHHPVRLCHRPPPAVEGNKAKTAAIALFAHFALADPSFARS